MTSDRSWTSSASPCGPATTVPGRCTALWARSPAPARPSTSTTPLLRSTHSPTACARRRNSSGPSDVAGPVMQLESMYQEIILDHYRHPHHKGLRDPFDAEVHHVNPTCGDEVTLRVALKDAGGEPAVADVSYESMGCSISQASTSMLTDMVIGKTVAEAMDINGEFLRLMRSEERRVGKECRSR